MSNISKLYSEWRAVQPLREDLQRRMDQSFMVDFNFNSNHLEGNTLTYGQTKLLLLFGKVTGEGLMRDFEEMKAHNVGLEMMKLEALDRERPLSELFIRELNRTILAGDFYKVSRDGEYRYKIHTGVYKTRPNSVVTPAGALFDYASPEETPALMSDLIAWYNGEEKAGSLSAIELAALLHYRYIRIHPFEDGNGRIARLLVNYILYRHGYPMVVIPSADRRSYLSALGKCDAITGKEPFNGANAAIEQIYAFVDFISVYVEKKLNFVMQLYRGAIRSIDETAAEQQKERIDPNNVSVNVRVNVSVKEKIIEIV
ncbi:MAG: Fic family protein, partial [Prevotellaceae bacterium]|nr:Fic family protein [Prevotellaceae bacterium]